MTVTIQIGNTDNKLTQQEWGMFVERVDCEIRQPNTTVHFMGGPSNWEPWQNVAWVIEIYGDARYLELLAALRMARAFFRQDSIAWTEGRTAFV